MKNIVLHPFLIPLFPLLSLFVAVANLITFQQALGTILSVWMCAILLWLIASLVFSDRVKGGIIFTTFILSFFSFQYVVTSIAMIVITLYPSASMRNIAESGNWLLIWLGAWGIFNLGTGLVVFRTRRKLIAVNRLLNIASIVLVFLVLGSWLMSVVRTFTPDQSQSGFQKEWERELAAESVPLTKPVSNSSPDIYYIILDGYARADILKELYGLDNRDFVRFLTDKGFYVAEQSRSNYLRTALSLASSLNMMYLDELAEQKGSRSTDWKPLRIMINDSFTFRQLKEMGYAVISFSTGYSFTDIATADKTLSPGFSISDFQNVLIGSTPLSAFLLGMQYATHRERILYSLEHLQDATSSEGPKFVFVHILAPHPPFVFGPNGEPIYPNRKYKIDDGTDFTSIASREEYVQQYRYQLIFINRKVAQAIEEILELSSGKAVIILQGDHGPGSMFDHNSLESSNLSERASILNAYYLPGVSQRPLYTAITPVNTFRLVFNMYFGTNYPLLTDRTYYSPASAPYLFTDITDRLDEGYPTIQAHRQ